jgi:hypothetical protein
MMTVWRSWTRSLAIAAAVFLSTGALAGCADRTTGPPSGVGGGSTKPGAPEWTLSERGAKTMLALKLRSAPGLIVLGGSRALRFQPGYVRRVTGLRAFNAAVPHAVPADGWAFVNLFHSRFQKARFRFLWIIHVDEFDQFGLSASLLRDPFLSRYLPADLVSSGLRRARSASRAATGAGSPGPVVLGPNGKTVADSISAAANGEGTTFRQRVDDYISRILGFYRGTPPVIDPLHARYFRSTLHLMNRLGATPTIVLPPLQPRFLAGIYHHGWAFRHRMVLAYLRGLQRTYRFHLLDFSRVSSIGASPIGFYDGVHMKPATTRLLLRAVLRAVPHAFAGTSGPHGR